MCAELTSRAAAISPASPSTSSPSLARQPIACCCCAAHSSLTLEVALAHCAPPHGRASFASSCTRPPSPASDVPPTSTMDAYLKPSKPEPATSGSRAPSVKPAEGKPRPYATLADAPKASSESASLNKIQGGVREANKALIKTLGKEDNPITNSTAYQRTLHVQSCSTGHQGGGGPGRSWNLTRNAKLTVQAANAETNTLKGVIACISGYTGDDVTNMQLRELVQHQGGKMVTVPSARCTHVFIRENLSGSKAQKFLESNRKNGTKLVTPQWATECARRGRRVSEAQFAAPVYNEAQESAYTIFTTAAARGSVSPSDASTSSSISPPAVADPSTSSTSFFPPVPPAAPSTPRARTRSQTGSSPRSTSLLPAVPVARSPSPRKRPSTTTSTSTSTTASATSLLLAQLAAQAAQRSHGGDVSPGRELRTGTKRRSTHVATWECAGHVRSPPRVRKGAEKAPGEEEGGKKVRGEGGGGKRRKVERDTGEADVLVLGSSDVECEVGQEEQGVEAGEREDETSDGELDEWGMPPSGQGR
ncbi:hypothetical protein JCM8208_003883 [Rhodotorula glutinis]